MKVVTANPSGSKWHTFNLSVCMSFTSGKLYGEYKHKLTIQEIPSHAHKFNDCAWIDGKGNIQSASNNSWFNGGFMSNTTSAGGDKAHNNLQPSFVVFFWRRTA